MNEPIFKIFKFYAEKDNIIKNVYINELYYLIIKISEIV